jgi:hypothetical protein
MWMGPRVLWLLLIGFSLLAVPGCGGCFRRGVAAKKQAVADKEAALAERLKKPKKKPDFEIKRITLEPVAGDDDRLRSVKPGHWVIATQEMKTNNFDFDGRLEAHVGDTKGQPIRLPGTPFQFTTSRPAALPKGQPKNFEMVLFVPPGHKTVGVSSLLRGRGGGRQSLPSQELFTAMPDYEYLFVVLARNRDRYGYLKALDSVRSPWEDDLDFRPLSYYQVVAPPIGSHVSLPSQPLVWTSIAYVLWDDVDGRVLSGEQQTALVDWLHWGGRLIISGPDSIDALRGGFLGPYLPVTAAPSCQLAEADLGPLSSYWTLGGRGRSGVPLVVTSAWSGVKLQLSEGARMVPHTGGLLAERQVGRGRIVVSAFRLDQRALLRWNGFDGFFNACLLGRPRRRYVRSDIQTDFRLQWADHQGHERDSRFVTGLRYFTRDTFLASATADLYRAVETQDDGAGGPAGRAEAGFGGWPPPDTLPGQTSRNRRRPGDGIPSAASWNARSDVARLAVGMLRDAAGITIPRAEFVVWVLVVYLLVLVPGNYLVFRSLGRVEWAWVAAPVIALVCTAAVVRLAQLDIGFARSETEIAVLETQAGYPRGHLTRYTAIYTSLGTTYDLIFDDPSVLAQPLSGRMPCTVDYARFRDVRLTGLRVDSNTTSTVHSEQMFDMGGGLKLGRSDAGQRQVINGTHLSLSQVAVIRKRVTEAGSEQVELCQIGDLSAGAAAQLSFRPHQPGSASRPVATRSSRSEAPLRLDRLIHLALDPRQVEPGEVRLVGQVDASLAGLTVDPAAPQRRGATLIVAHLTFPDRPSPQADVNSRGDFESPVRSLGRSDAAEAKRNSRNGTDD